MSEPEQGRPPRKRLRRLVLLLATVLLAVTIVVLGILVYLAPRLRQEILAAVSDKTGRQVELSALDWSLWPDLGLTGEGLVIGSRNQESPPLVRVERFSVQMTPAGLWASPRRIESLKLEDLEVYIAREKRQPEKPKTASPDTLPTSPKTPVTIGRILASNARIEIASTSSEKGPRIFQIERLELDSFDLREEVAFLARLRYPRPQGDLAVEGRFGPLEAADPKRTPFSGQYDFIEADLGVFGQIQGKLTTRGRFEGSLLQTRVAGQAQIPDFRLTKVENVVPLETDYETEVLDNGAVIQLKKVETSFRQSVLLTSGAISKQAETEGRLVDLDVSTQKARVEDLVAFAVKAEQPPLTGDIVLQTSVTIPPGSTPFIQRLDARGDFHISRGRFSNIDIQKTLEKISRIGGRGESEAESGSGVFSDMKGTFHLQNARIDFSQLDFGVPGMKLELSGSYVFEGQTLDFKGDAMLERAPSEIAPESISKWIRIIDPILRGAEAGTVLPIKITGTRSQPRFSIDYRRLGRRSP